MIELLTQAILEALHQRAIDNGDQFELSGNKVSIRCFQPQNHKTGDSHPSAEYHLGKYAYCRICKFKEGEKKLAERLGVGLFNSGLTLSALAFAKNLPVDFLQKWGWRTQSGKDERAKVLIPWYSEEGVMKYAPAYHLRHYINKDDDTGPRFTWDLPKGTDLKPYGIWRHKEFQEAANYQKMDSYIFIAESEIDTLTLWLHHIPANATGSADGWRSGWAKYFVGFKRVIVAQEPGSAGKHMINLIAKDFRTLSINNLPELLTCQFPDDTKDANALHLKVGGDRDKFQENLKGLISKAVPVNLLAETREDEEQIEQQQNRDEEHTRLLALAAPLLSNPAILHKAISTVESLGVVGEGKNIGLIRLQFRSRALTRPVNIMVDSPSGTGKTFVVLKTCSLEDPSAYYELTAGSEKALIYLNEPLNNRILYVQEPEGLAEGVGAAIIKSLIWEGRLKYDTVVQQDGDFVGKHIEKDGPTGLIVTTTQPLEAQINNRLLRLEVDDSEDQTRRILNAIADSANGNHLNIDYEPWHAMSSLLGEPAKVHIYFGRFLADKVSVSALRIRRDFTHLLALIMACAIEHRFQRSLTDDGSVMATVADYAMVHALVADIFQAAQAEGINQADRSMVAAVIELSTPVNGNPGDKPITQAALRTYMKLSKSSASYRVKRLLTMGYINNLSDRGRDMKLVPGAPLPDEPSPLPSPCDLSVYLSENGHQDLIIPWVDPVTGDFHDCRQHLDEKYFSRAFSSPQLNPEPQPDLDLISRGSASVEPPELSPENGSIGSNKAEPSIFESKVSKGSEVQAGVKDTDNRKNLVPGNSLEVNTSAMEVKVPNNKDFKIAEKADKDKTRDDVKWEEPL